MQTIKKVSSIMNEIVDCIFCEIVTGRSPAKFVYSSPMSVGIIPLGPVVPGHVIFMPTKHTTDFSDNPDITANTFKEACDWWKSFNDGPANLITSKGAVATQTVLHLHIHIVPRTEGDGLALPWHSGKE